MNPFWNCIYVFEIDCRAFNHLFNDPLDRFYITTANFDPNKLFSDESVPYADGMLVYFDKRHNGHKDHYMTKSSSIRLYWRTVVQFHSTLIDRFAAGFRLLAYPATSKSYVNTQMKYTALKMAVGWLVD